MEKIYSITEAFSQQPCTLYVGMTHYPSKETIMNIEKEIVCFAENGQDNQFDYYVGYTSSGKKAFQFRCETVNVIFQ
jgi:hypothetical protein